MELAFCPPSVFPASCPDFVQARCGRSDEISVFVSFSYGAGRASLAAYARAEVADKLVWQGDLAAAVPMLDEALATLRHGSSDVHLAMALGQRGHAALRQEDQWTLQRSNSGKGRTDARERATVEAVIECDDFVSRCW